MIDLLVYLRDPYLEPVVEDLFTSDNYYVQIVDQLPRLQEIAADKIFDLMLIWPATEKNLLGLAESLGKVGLGYLPLVAVLNEDQDPAALSGIPLNEIISLPLSRPEFRLIIETIVNRRQCQSEKRRGTFWQGNISEYNLIDLLQLIEGGGSDVELRLSAGGYVGLIQFDKGRVVSASLDRHSGFAALQRMTFWNSGTFSTHPISAAEVSSTFSEDHQQLLLSLLEQTTLMDQVLSGLPGIEEQLLVNRDMLTESSTGIEKEITDLAARPVSLLGIVNTLKHDPLEILQSLAGLYQKQIVGLRQDIENLLQEPEKTGLDRMLSSLSSFLWRKKDQPMEEYRFFDAGPDGDEVVLKVQPPLIDQQIAEAVRKRLKEQFD